MKLYRVEMPDGRGPYNSDAPSHDYDEEAETHKPVLSIEGLGYDDIFRYAADRPKRFAFRTIDQLRRWFSLKECKSLKRLGYVIGTYDVDKNDIVVSTPCQIVFFKDKATRTGALPWKAVLKEDLFWA